MANRPQPETRFVLFDLGGVLIKLGGVDAFGELIGITDHDEVWRLWLTSPWVRRYERGRCTRQEFAAGVIAENRIDRPPEVFLRMFGDWPKGLMPGAVELVRGLARGITPACLSNTNEMHWNEQKHAEILHELFEQRFLSHEIGLIKPDREIFDHVVSELGCRPSEVLFLNDNQLNVQGALAAGLDAHRAIGVEGSRELLEARGLLG